MSVVVWYDKIQVPDLLACQLIYSRTSFGFSVHFSSLRKIDLRPYIKIRTGLVSNVFIYLSIYGDAR